MMYLFQDGKHTLPEPHVEYKRNFAIWNVYLPLGITYFGRFGIHELYAPMVMFFICLCHLDQRGLGIPPALGKHCYTKLNPL